jgi:low temperature requirement protein LtrA
MIVAMVAVFLMALSIRDVWSDDVGAVAASVLVSGYIVLRAVHAALYLLAASDDRHLRRQVLVTYCGAAASIALLIVGATVGADARLGWWLAALVLDALLTWVLAARVGGWRVRSASHFAERFHLVVIVALGESVVAIGVGAAGVPLDARLLVTAVIGILLSVALWWTYFRLDAEQLEHRLALASGRSGDGWPRTATPICTSHLLLGSWWRRPVWSRPSPASATMEASRAHRPSCYQVWLASVPGQPLSTAWQGGARLSW